MKENPASNGGTSAARSAFVARLHLILRHWPSADRLARASGVSPSAFRKWLKGEAEPSRERLVALADAAKVSIAWLVAGEGPTPAFAAAEAGNGGMNAASSAAILDKERFLLLPNHLPATGENPPSEPPRHQYIAFRHDWIRWLLRSDPSALLLETAGGEAMAPTIRPGDLLLVDMRDRATFPFGIYMIEVGGQRMVRRVQRKHDGSLVLISDNALYQPDLIPADSTRDIVVIGRIVWVGGTV